METQQIASLTSQSLQEPLSLGSQLMLSRLSHMFQMASNTLQRTRIHPPTVTKSTCTSHVSWTLSNTQKSMVATATAMTTISSKWDNIYQQDNLYHSQVNSLWTKMLLTILRTAHKRFSLALVSWFSDMSLLLPFIPFLAKQPSTTPPSSFRCHPLITWPVPTFRFTIWHLKLTSTHKNTTTYFPLLKMVLILYIRQRSLFLL